MLFFQNLIFLSGNLIFILEIFVFVYSQTNLEKRILSDPPATVKQFIEEFIREFIEEFIEEFTEKII